MLPAPAHSAGIVHHRGSISGNPSMMKRRLQQPALFAMQFAVGSEQAVAKQSLRPLQALPFGEIVLVRDQDSLDLSRVVQEKDVRRSGFEMNQVAILLSHFCEEPQRVMDSPQGEEEARFDFRPRQ